ncbi:MAG: hypothetical protein GXO29_01595 [Thermotogae bacterium]|nr:hypothetical protein [Thermotogota bacterium]
MFPFIPDTAEVLIFQSHVYQSVDINSCRREDLEALPFLTPEQIDVILRNRPYRDWRDFVRRSGLPLPLLYALRNLITFGDGSRYYRLFAKYGTYPSLSVKGRSGDYYAYLYASAKRKAATVGYEGFLKVAAGNLVMASPLGFAGYGGFYTGGWGPRYNVYAPPSLLVGVGSWMLKLDTVGVIGGVVGAKGGLLVSRTHSGVAGGVGYVRVGPLSLESALGRGGYGFGVAASRGGIGFRLRYVRGEGFWPEGTFSRDYALWFSVPFAGYLFRSYVSSQKRRLSLVLRGRGYVLKAEYYEVPRITLRIGGLEGGVCWGCLWGGYRGRFGWIRMYSFNADGIHFYEYFVSSRTFSSRKGFRLSGGVAYGDVLGLEGFAESGSYGWTMWFLLRLR